MVFVGKKMCYEILPSPLIIAFQIEMAFLILGFYLWNILEKYSTLLREYIGKKTFFWIKLWDFWNQEKSHSLFIEFAILPSRL